MAAMEYVKGQELLTILQQEARAVASAEFENWRKSQALAGSQPPPSASTITGVDQNERVGKRFPRKKGGPNDTTA